MLTKSFDYIFVFNYFNYLEYNNNYINTNLLFLANLMLLIGVIAKSAQLGLHT
jgi:NADH:ubiquinone oxidoreductase subunit 5 (subunit L)/multisubunit Na+/H+ antiporter MnhA subunit